ncbi:unnamed protein product [Paramecium sonneborni]|uniref:Transmembrane protein n=1 Tax=Paramecium sonneborni TaxID=65129 RepID=A0A8S1QE32_9CILI|nr:unnamed protein product [Paramecium sonneborni]
MLKILNSSLLDQNRNLKIIKLLKYLVILISMCLFELLHRILKQNFQFDQLFLNMLAQKLQKFVNQFSKLLEFHNYQTKLDKRGRSFTLIGIPMLQQTKLYYFWISLILNILKNIWTFTIYHINYQGQERIVNQCQDSNTHQNSKSSMIFIFFFDLQVNLRSKHIY